MVELNGYTREDVIEALKVLIDKGEIEILNKKQKEELDVSNEFVIKYINKVFFIHFYNDCTIIKELYNLNERLNESEIKELLEKTINNK
ncbi:MAG: hypothetical protein ACLUG2_04435 [Clostridium perfringens]|uniref:hypothetical protein n=1 Tax=Clostridium perfringens TaxID=1502 RepID=UPI00244BA98C|nr:hypothetical protein [Clostridium perfringens]MDH2460242.1 hypothetical protein [Clostridium perfringens]MDU1475394.1 hypothetical protein [Clostridium perfringens]MDU2828155.1 hypothetical protein [Clostridium perfringens]MDZ4994024.1 hypothetical protein [Clostridium perfringens]